MVAGNISNSGLDGHQVSTLVVVIGRQSRRRFLTLEGRSCLHERTDGWVVCRCGFGRRCKARCSCSTERGSGRKSSGLLLADAWWMGTKVFGSEKPKGVTGVCLAATSGVHNGLIDGARPWGRVESHGWRWIFGGIGKRVIDATARGHD